MNELDLFDIAALAATLPEVSETMLRDLRLVDREAASCRIFRVYRPVGLHFHESCDEYLYVLQGRALFQVGSAAQREVGPGMLIHFPKRTVHGTPALLEEPFVVLAIDTPRRPPDDVTFVDPREGDASSFIATETKKPGAPLSAPGEAAAVEPLNHHAVANALEHGEPAEASQHNSASLAEHSKAASPSVALACFVQHDTLEGTRLRQELAELRQVLVAREQHLGELRAQLVSFEGRYMRQVGLLYRRLDAWEQKIAELHGRVAEESEAASDDAEDAATPGQMDPAAFKVLFRELAKVLHPDFASDAADERRRTRLMALANDAYAREDSEAIRRMLLGYDAADAQSSARSGNALHRLAARLRQVKLDIAAVDLQTEELQRSGSAQLQARVLDTARQGRDLLAEMAARVNGSIGLAMRQYELDVSRKQRPAKGFAVASLLSAEDTPRPR